MFTATRYTFETLEPRQVLSAHALAQGIAALHHDSDHSGGAALIANPHSQHATVNALSASLSDPANSDVSGSVQFISITHRGETKARLLATIHGADPDTIYDVTVAGTVVGQIETNDDGDGHLMLSTNPHGKQQGFPDGFSTHLAAGATVSVGDATGTLASRPGHHGDDDDDGDEDQVRLGAFLSDAANSSLRAVVQFHSETGDDGTETTFRVKVTGADPNTDLEVMIGGVTVGTITTNAAGRGSLVLSSEDGTLPANFPTTVSAGDTVAVGPLSGELNTVTNFGHHRR